jgi:hypothetical protein
MKDKRIPAYDRAVVSFLLDFRKPEEHSFRKMRGKPDG